jgi:guanosine-3',5'-bis(diphosphate) 3'-pyrophosphohydrolase
MESMELFTNWHTSGQAVTGMRELPAQTIEQVSEAIEFASAAHGEQRRPTGVPYLEHLLEALEALVRGAGIADPDLLCAAVLHDVLEDTAVTAAELEKQFGPRVAELVGWVTIPAPGPGADKATVKRQALQRLTSAPRDAVLVKLADRLSNVQTLRNLSPERQRMYYDQTMRFIVPLAAADPWFERWYADWQVAHADLAS